MVNNPLSFKTAKAITEAEPIEPDYVAEQLLIKGAITSFSAKVKAGKTTFLGYMVRSILNDEPIINLATRATKILYCTEEGPKTFTAFLRRVGLEDSEQIEACFLGSVPRELPWDITAKFVLAYALSVNALVVVFDTLTRWARIPADKENDPGTAAEAMIPLEGIRDSGIAVMAVFHDRKSGGDIGDSQRGSSAFTGAADILLRLENPGTHGHPNRRVLEQIGRFDDPATWVIDLQDGTYVLVGDDGSQQVERKTYKARIVELLSNGELLTQIEIAERMSIQSTNSTLARALRELVKEGTIVSSGKGVKNDPARYRDALAFVPK